MVVYELFIWNANNISAIASSSATIIAALALCAGWYQIKKLNGRNEYDTYNQVKKDIDSDFVRKLIKVIKNSSIEIVSDIPAATDPGNIFSGDLTSKFLDHVEDLYIYYSKGLITSEIIDSGFGRIILMVGNERKVEAFIDNLRTTNDDNNIYAGFHELYKLLYSKLPKHQKSKYRKDIL